MVIDGKNCGGYQNFGEVKEGSALPSVLLIMVMVG
jgi:hypothetical protein